MVLRNLSFDVVLGALASGAMAQAVMETNLTTTWFVVLALCVWLMYTIDHLLDAWRVGSVASTSRHRFHYRHRKALLAATLVATMLTGCVVWLYFPVQHILFGASILAITALHFFIVHSVRHQTKALIHKEALVATIYSAGIWGIPIIEASTVGLKEMLLVAGFFALAYGNLLMFAMFEEEVDRKDGHQSLARAIGMSATKRLTVALCILAVAFAVSAATLGPDAVIATSAAAFCAIAVIFIGITLRPQYFGAEERYRMYGDAAFFLPAIPAIMHIAL